MEPTDLAYLLVRILESFIYADMITGDEPDAAKVAAAIGALLHVPEPGPAPATGAGGSGRG